MSTRVWMRPMPPANKNLTYSPLMSLVTKQSQIGGKSYSPLDLQPFEFLFAFLGPGFFLPLTQGELSRFRFPGRFMVVSQQIRLTCLLAWTTNETQTLREHITWFQHPRIYSRVKLTRGLKCWHVITPLGINFLVTQNTLFAITLLEKFVLKYMYFLRKARRVGYLM